jgi:tetratricopeptide (TPR) repeat protein
MITTIRTSMKRWKISGRTFLYVFLLTIFNFQFTVFNSFAGSPQDDFIKANELYKHGDYENAVKAYEKMLNEGNTSAEIYFNLGNSYYKLNNVSKSILNYERGLKLAPDDEDINFNLRIAQLKVADKIEPLPEIFYVRWLKSLTAWLPLAAWSTVFLACFWLLFLSAGFYLFAHSSAAKKTAFALILVFMFLSLSSFLVARESHRSTATNIHAVIASASVYVKSSPDEKGNDLFILHEGTKVNVLDELGEWKKIRIANGTVGWLKVHDIEVI